MFITVSSLSLFWKSRGGAASPCFDHFNSRY